MYLLEDSNEQVDQKNVCHEKVAGHNSRCQPGTRDTWWQFLPILIIQMFTTWSCGEKVVIYNIYS